MKLIGKFMNLFTEEVEEEKEIKKETRHVEIQSPKQEKIPTYEKKEEPVISDLKSSIIEPTPTKEDKNFFFADEEFEDLPASTKKIVKLREEKEEAKPYNGAKITPKVEEKKVFKPTPIISPVYGILDKNYKKEDITPYTKSSKSFYRSNNITVDDVRKRAFSSLEDDIKNDIVNELDEKVVDDLNIFSDENFLDDSIEEEKMPKINTDLDINLDDETRILAEKLEEQKRKLDEINEIINDNSVSHKSVKNVDDYLYQDKQVINLENEYKDILNEDSDENLDTDLENSNIEDTDIEVSEYDEKPKNIDEALKDAMDDLEVASKKTPSEEKVKNKNMSDSELFNLIDSMYEKGDETDE